MSDASVDAAPADPAIVGTVVRPHGLVGEVVVAPADPGTTVFEPGGRVWLAGAWREIRASRASGGRRVIAVEGVGDRDAAERLRGEELAIEAGDLPDLDQGRYYIHDLVGCTVRDPLGNELGVVVAVVPGPQDWLEVENDGARSLVPMVRDMVKDVDIGQRRIVVDAPPGLVEATGG